MTEHEQLNIINSILDFAVPVIPENTRFWMIRTQKGYFYNEFVSRRFVALAWNIIDHTTNFSESNKDVLKDAILMEYEEIQRPSTVINKCKIFINDIKEGDILIIPSAGSHYITFARAGGYYEDDSKTPELEHRIIEKIINHDIDITDVSCPYKKRRHITLLRTVRSEELNYSLCRAISNYHGISNMDSYAKHILNALYNYYYFQDTLAFVYSIKKTEPIRPRELNSILYGTTEILCCIAPEETISNQLSLNSPGDIVYYIKAALEFFKDNWAIFFGLLVFVGGGSALSFQVPGVIDILKSIFTAPAELKEKMANAELKELEVLEKKVEVYEKIKASGIDPKALSKSLDIIVQSSTSLKSAPIVLDDAAAATLSEEAAMTEPLDVEEE